MSKRKNRLLREREAEERMRRSPDYIAGALASDVPADINSALTPSVLPLARKLGEKLGGEPWARDIPTLEPIHLPVARLTNYLAFGFKSQAEMDAAFSGEEGE